MAYGLLGHCTPAAATTETLIYTTPLNKKTVGSLVIVNSASSDARATVLCVTGAVTGSLFSLATGGITGGITLTVYNILLKDTSFSSTFSEMPAVIAGIVLGPGQSLIAYNNSGTKIHYSFNGIEENV
jgi:hypothetical protein